MNNQYLPPVFSTTWPWTTPNKLGLNEQQTRKSSSSTSPVHRLVICRSLASYLLPETTPDSNIHLHNNRRPNRRPFILPPQNKTTKYGARYSATSCYRRAKS